MTVARWGLSSMWGIQTAAIQRAMARARQAHPSAGLGAVLAAVTSQARKGPARPSKRPGTRKCRLEAHCGRQCYRAFAKLLKLREKVTTQSRDDDFRTEANFEAGSSPNSERDLNHKE